MQGYNPIKEPVHIHPFDTIIMRWSGWSRTDYLAIQGADYTDTTGWFTNLIFCNPFADTQTFHYETRFGGSANGAWNWSYSMNKDGGDGDCSGLLSYHYTVVTP